VEQPRAVIVDLAELSVPQRSLLRVFGNVWARTHQWPATPLALAAGSADMRHDLEAAALSRSIPVYGSLPEALRNIDTPPLRLRARTVLPAELSSARAARRFVAETCREWPVDVAHESSDDATVAITELVENAARHTTVPELHVRVEWRPGKLTVACEDADPRPAVLGDPATDERLGLLLVAQISRSWGCLAHPAGGKVVWAILDLERASRRHSTV
jgi:anti-sigma regulatory factor (Ser/Thr protein kinase)